MTKIELIALLIWLAGFIISFAWQIIDKRKEDDVNVEDIINYFIISLLSWIMVFELIGWHTNIDFSTVVFKKKEEAEELQEHEPLNLTQREIDDTIGGQIKKLDDALFQLCIDITPKFIRKWIDNKKL